MQVSGNGLGATVGSTYAKEGAAAFWKGIVWAWGREGSYASIKLGAYAPVRDAIGAGEKDCEFPVRLFIFARKCSAAQKSCLHCPTLSLVCSA